MKYQTTNKAVNNGYTYVIRVPYCALQDLLRPVSPVAYTCGVYGWNSDIYEFGNVAISTGYRPTGNIIPAFSYNRVFNDRALHIWNTSEPYKKRAAAVKELISDYIQEVLYAADPSAF